MQSTPTAGSAFYHPDAEHIAHNRRGFWIAALIELVGLLIFVGLFNLVFDRIGDGFIGDGLDGFFLIFLGLLMSLVPAGLWLGFFYRMDRLDPEPKEKLIGVFILGALVTAAIAIPFLESNRSPPLLTREELSDNQVCNWAKMTAISERFCSSR